MTQAIELIGLAILLVFVIVPLKEFRHILTRLRHKPTISDFADSAGSADPEAPRGFDVVDPPEGRRE
jgi:hypothetical protein